VPYNFFVFKLFNAKSFRRVQCSSEDSRHDLRSGCTDLTNENALGFVEALDKPSERVIWDFQDTF
jgi:hypothetical protein